VRVPFGTSPANGKPQTCVVATSSLAIVDAVLLDHRRRQPRVVRPFARALDVIVDLGTLVLMAWLIPFAILAIASPVVLILWAALALIHRL